MQQSPTTGAPQSQLRALCGSPRGRFPHPLDCRKYLDCWDGRVLEVQCPNDLAYSDLSGGFCDYLEYVDCGLRPVKPLPEVADWSNARSLCQLQGNGSDLVSIESEAEHLAISARITELGSPDNMNDVRDLSEQPETPSFPALRAPQRIVRRRQQIHGF
ncbi:hypothetical protein B566_EDAN010242 [Ephemera danica]|nr:hypothetical protein B566_EDAN010242 [Ephemera danica]